MAAIGSIRKHGILLMCIIGIALLAFVMGDITQLSEVFSDKYTMVKINNKKLDDEYRVRLEQNSALWKMFYEKSQLDETDFTQVHDMTWNQLLEQTIMEEQLKKLGLTLTKEMLEEISSDMVASLYSQQPNHLLQRLANVLAKQVTMEQAIGFISNIEDYRNEPDVRDFYLAYKAIERFSVIDAQRTRFMALAQNTVTFSDEAARYFVSNNKTMVAQAVTILASAPQFSEINATVTDKEVKEWYKQHSNRYKINENSRDIDVAFFPIQPSPEDLVAIQDTAINRAERLRTAPSVEDYNIAMMHGQLDSVYYKRGDITIDTLAQLIFDRPVGTFIEPFQYENSVWFYGKTYGTSKRPDSLNIAYLVIDFKTDRNPSSQRTKEEAQAIADSLKNILQKGGDIFPLIPDYLGGRREADTTVWLTEFMEPRLYNSLLTDNIYTLDGFSDFRIFQVLQRTPLVEKRQFVLYSEEIKPSDATIKSIRSQAIQLQAESNSAEELKMNAAQKGIQVMQGQNITSMMSAILQLQNVREIVSWAFNPNTKIDDISDVYNINNNQLFAVAAVRNIHKKGIPKLEVVRHIIEDELTAKKKLELIQNTISEQLNSGVSVQEIAEKYQAAFMDSVRLTFGGEGFQNRGIENPAIGKIFSLPTQQPAAVIGKNNLYVVSVYHYNDPGEPSANYTVEKSALRNAVAGRNRTENTILEGLKEVATITDQRFLYYAR